MTQGDKNISEDIEDYVDDTEDEAEDIYSEYKEKFWPTPPEEPKGYTLIGKS